MVNLCVCVCVKASVCKRVSGKNVLCVKNLCVEKHVNAKTFCVCVCKSVRTIV